MSERAPYSRVYWTIRNDARLAAVYPSDANLAAWLRLLIAADMAWPAPADIPAGVNRRALRALEEAGVIEVRGTMYTFHGLDTERGRRRDAAASSAGHRWGSGRDADGMRSDTGRNASRAEPSRAETSRAEPREDDPADTYWTLTGKYPTDRTTAWLDDLTETYGAPAVISALGTCHIEDSRTGTLLGRVKDVLARDARRLDMAEREAEKARVVELRKPTVLRQRQPEATPEEADAALEAYYAAGGRPRPIPRPAEVTA